MEEYLSNILRHEGASQAEIGERATWAGDEQVQKPREESGFGKQEAKGRHRPCRPGGLFYAECDGKPLKTCVFNWCDWGVREAVVRRLLQSPGER